MFDKGEIVVVSNPINPHIDSLSDEKIKYVYVQKFDHEAEGIFYCERDDGKDGLIGWGKCRKRESFELPNYKYHATG